MGLADFLAQAGNRTVIGQVAQAFGGRTSHQQAMDDFTNQVQAITQEIHNNTDETKVRELGGKMLGLAAKAGIPIQHAEKLMEATIGPAIHGIRQEGLNKLGGEYAGQPAVAAESRPEINGVPKEGPLTPQGNFIDPKAATPGKPLDLNFMMRFGQLTGANPEQFNKMLETPGLLTSKLLSNKETQAKIDKETQAQQQRQNLPNTPLGPGQPSLRDIGTLAPAGLPQTLPVRTNPLDEKKSEVMDAQIRNLNHLADKPYPEPGGSGGHGSGEYQDYIRLLPPGQTPSMEGFQAYLDRRRGAGKTNATEADQPYGSLDREIDLKAIARDAHAQDKTSSADIKALAAQRGLEVEGDPQLTVSGGAFGYGGTPSLTGNFELKKKPRVTTKGKAGSQGRYDTVLSGSAPTPDAGGRGRGQAPTSQTSGAPQAAINYLKAHPDSAPQFKAKYGYLP